MYLRSWMCEWGKGMSHVSQGGPKDTISMRPSPAATATCHFISYWCQVLGRRGKGFLGRCHFNIESQHALWAILSLILVDQTRKLLKNLFQSNLSILSYPTNRGTDTAAADTMGRKATFPIVGPRKDWKCGDASEENQPTRRMQGGTFEGVQDQE